ncbi:hypothetical protein L211DRAFT_848703 [Terfezia boudieri ATCC MYA-4762]|uniref:Uncharacterized protein n=1 Tax=Terfezia boudieri ATCC MYA-4762 TaxID=1051890 RepID=A0A3N4M3L3_9PEZI|nr:hypothetical protein L211DRAFT_848703 [Terfezia boudieri ATCC MYA-4762]
MTAHKDITRMQEEVGRLYEEQADTPSPNMGMALEDLEDQELGWEGERERQYNPIAKAAYILRNPAGNSNDKRTNAKNRECRELNWAKVRPMMVQILTGRQPNPCNCGERKEKSVLNVSLTACFNFLDHEATHPAFISVDGNMQLRRFKDAKDINTNFREYEELPTSLFLSINRQYYGNAHEDDPADDENIEASVEDATSFSDTSCESQFKAIRSWESTTENTKQLKSFAALDKIGVMGMISQKLGVAIIEVILHRERLSHILSLRLRKARQVEEDSTKSLTEFYARVPEETSILYTEAFLQKQLDLQEEYYRTYSLLPNDPNDEISKAILHEQDLLDEIQMDLAIFAKGQAALRRTTQLLTENEQAYEEWEDKADPQVQKALIANCTLRRMELHGLRHFVHRHQKSRKFVNSLNARWKTISKDIAVYNKLLKKLPAKECPRRLDPKAIKEYGLLLDSFWDMNRLQIQHEWARNVVVRVAMGNLLKLRQAKEERAITTLEVQRVLQWLEAEIHAYDYGQEE